MQKHYVTYSSSIPCAFQKLKWII